VLEIINESLISILIILLAASFVSPLMRGAKSLTTSSLLTSAASILMILLSLEALLKDLTLTAELAIPAFLNLGVTSYSLILDPLSAIFTLILGLIGFTASIYGLSYIRRYLGVGNLTLYSFIYPAFILSMYLLLTTYDVIAFIIFWELMTITAFFLISFEREKEVARRAALKYLIMSYSGSGLIIVSLMALVVLCGSTSYLDLSKLKFNDALQYTLITFLTIGFGIKSALVPMHSWLPDAHPEAPSNVSALLSGVMIKMAVYGLIRFAIQLLSLNHYVLGLILASLGIASALFGSIMALIQIDSKKLMAYSSVGQIGYVFLAIGGGLTLYPDPLSIIAISAGILHVVNHAIFKGLLFLTAGSIIYRTGSRDLNKLGGLARYMPITTSSGLIASLAISGMPPLNGFVSKWLIIISLLISGNSILTVYAAIAIFVSALTAGYFMKYLSRAFLANPGPSIKGEDIMEVPLPMAISEAILAALCVLLGVYFQALLMPILRVFNTILSVDSETVIDLLLSNAFKLLQSFAIILMIMAASSTIALCLLRISRIRITPVWTFGSRDLIPQRLSLDSSSYYTEFTHTYSFGYELRYYLYKFIIDPLTNAFMRFVSYYNNIDTYLYFTLVILSIFITALIVIAVVI